MTDVVENPAESAAAETEPVPINETITATEVDAEAAPITTEETVEGILKLKTYPLLTLYM